MTRGTPRREVSSRDWFGKGCAGLLLGFLLALGAAGLLKLVLGVGDTFFSTRGQLTMWLMSPVWTLVLSGSFLFSRTARAWGWLGLAAGLLWAGLWLAGATA